MPRFTLVLGLSCGITFSALMAAPSLVYDTETSVTLSSSDAGLPWLSGGSGRFTSSADQEFYLEFEAGARLTLSDVWSVYVQGRINSSPGDHMGDAIGMTESYAEGDVPLSGGHALRFMAGLFLPPSSMENTDPLWQSPYTMTWSSLNSWIAEEVRLTGVDVAWRLDASEDISLGLGASAFVGNDASGALLAWRGWSMGSRLSGAGEDLPLPPLEALEDGGAFAAQSDDGTRPIGSDLDGDIGWLARTHLSSREWGVVQVTGYDNNGDRLLYDDEYSWRTRYQSLGVFSEPVEGLECSAEFMQGDTGMGDVNGPHVQLDFSSWYLLLSHRRDSWRVTGRYEEFSTEDIDKLTAPVNADPNDEDGSALTLAVFYYMDESTRFGLEWVNLDVDREEDLISGSEGSQSGQLIQLEARWLF